MVVDRLENLEKYASLNPLFAKAMEYLKTTDLNAQELGKVKLQGDDLVVNFSQTKPKTKEEAKLETHNQFIDIQIPLSGVEVMGSSPLVGSSKIKSSGSCRIALAIPRRCFMPREYLLNSFLSL